MEQKTNTREKISTNQGFLGCSIRLSESLSEGPIVDINSSNNQILINPTTDIRLMSAFHSTAPQIPYGAAYVKGIRMFGRITPVYIMPSGIDLCDGGKKRAGVYAYISEHEIEFGSTGCLRKRFYEKYSATRWSTHVFWMDLQKHHWISTEHRLYIEALCINYCCRTNFLNHQVRNYQLSKTMGRFAGYNHPVGNLGIKFINIIKRSNNSLERIFNTNG